MQVIVHCKFVIIDSLSVSKIEKKLDSSKTANESQFISTVL